MAPDPLRWTYPHPTTQQSGGTCLQATCSALWPLSDAFCLSLRYEMRRDCQEIIPGLLLGPFVVSKQLSRLQELGITHMYVCNAFARSPSVCL